MKVLSRSLERGINICCTKDMRRVFVLGHFEYDRETLATEYVRDKKKGMDPDLPEYYYPDNDSTPGQRQYRTAGVQVVQLRPPVLRQLAEHGVSGNTVRSADADEKRIGKEKR